jgi:flotillin
MLFWHVPAPNEALLISGSKRHKDATQFRIVTGHGSFVMPVKQKARVLSLALREAEITEECITNQGIRLNVRAVAAFKVGDDPASIANAARRFLSEQDRMETLVGRVFAGHLRSIIGGLTVEQIIRERDRVAQEIKDGSHAEMEKLGIVVDALEIQEIEDSSGYISNLAAPHASAAASRARIAKAQADLEATERELAAQSMKAQYERDMAIKQAGYLAETEQAKGRAGQAGPLAEAQAKQQVIQQQTALAQHQAELAAQHLEAEVRRPADAEAYRTRTLAEAGRDQARFTTEAEAFRTRELAQAEADANQIVATSLRQGNQELIAASLLVENLPALVEAAARGLAGANLTVLNGTQGVNEVVAGLVGQGFSILDLLKRSTVTAPVPTVNGSTPPAMLDMNA